jgi:hypothetical protein
MPAIITSGMVSSSNLPDRPTRRGGLGRGISLVGWLSVSDTISALDIQIQRMRFAPEPVKLRIANVPVPPI